MAYLRERVRWDASGSADPGDRLQGGGGGKNNNFNKKNNFRRATDLKLLIEAQRSY